MSLRRQSWGVCPQSDCHSGMLLSLPGGCFRGRVSARRRPTFLSRDKKVGKETRPNARDPCASLRGNLRRGGCGVRCGTRFALRAPLRQPQRVRSRSSPVLRQDCNPATTTPQALTYGRFASLGPGLKPSGAMAPAVGCWLLAVGCWLFPSLPFCPRLRWAGWWQPCRRTGLLRCLACRSCLNGLAAGARSEFCGTPRIPPNAGRPQRSEGSWAVWGALFPLSCRATRKRVGRRAEPRPRKTTTRQGQKDPPANQQKAPPASRQQRLPQSIIRPKSANGIAQNKPFTARISPTFQLRLPIALHPQDGANTAGLRTDGHHMAQGTQAADQRIVVAAIGRVDVSARRPRWWSGCWPRRSPPSTWPAAHPDPSPARRPGSWSRTG